MKKLLSFSMVSIFAALFVAQSAFAATGPFQVMPFTYLAPGEVCDVVSQWQTDPADNQVLFLKKGCSTATVAAAGADIITAFEGTSISNLTELNFDYKDDGHCGAGAPRFNVQVDGSTYFLGCIYGTHSTSTMPGWTHVEFGAADFLAAGIPLTGTLEDIYIIFDEGTDTPTGGSVVTAGQVYLDNISVNGDVVGEAALPTSKDECKDGGYSAFGFKNQGQCVSSVVRNNQ